VVPTIPPALFSWKGTICNNIHVEGRPYTVLRTGSTNPKGERQLEASKPAPRVVNNKAGSSLSYVSAIDSNGRTIWIADAHRDDGKRFIVRADEKLGAFLELEWAVCIHLLSEQC